MEHEENQFAKALAALNQNEAQIRDDFKQRANKDQKIRSEDIEAFLKEISELLGVDCSEASSIFHSADNNVSSRSTNASSFGFFEFMGLLESWLQQQISTTQLELDAENPLEDIGKDIEASLSQIHHPRASVDDEHFQNSNYEKNRDLLYKVLAELRREADFLFREIAGEDGDSIDLKKGFLFLEEFFEKGGLVFEAKGRTMKLGVFKERLNELSEKYLVNEKEMDALEIDQESVRLSFNDCFEFVEFWFKTDQTLVMMRVEHEKEIENENQIENKDAANPDFHGVLKDTIAKYEKMLAQSCSDLESQILQTTISTLKARLQQFAEQTEKAKEPENQEIRQKKEEKRKTALKEIFDFYCAQQLNVGRSSSTFDRLGRLLNTIHLGTFTMFLKNFRLKIDNAKMLELFRKTTIKDDNIGFAEFENLLMKVALHVDLVTEVKNHEPKPEIMKDYKPDSYKRDNTYKDFKEKDQKRREEFFAEKKKNPKQDYQMEEKRDLMRLEEIWQHMGIYDGSYKKHLGFVALAFGSQEREDFRIAPESIKYKFDQNKYNKEVNRYLKQSTSVDRKNTVQKKEGSLSVQTTLRLDPKEKATYADKKSQKQKPKEPKTSNLITFKNLEKMSCGDLIEGRDKFNPQDLIDENDEEDNRYLAEYTIQVSEQKIVEKKFEESDKRFENYGKLKKAKGFAVNGRYGRAPTINTNASPFGQPQQPDQHNQQIHIHAPAQFYYNSSSNNMSFGPPNMYPQSVKNGNSGPRQPFSEFDYTPVLTKKKNFIPNHYSPYEPNPNYGYNGGYNHHQNHNLSEQSYYPPQYPAHPYANANPYTQRYSNQFYPQGPGYNSMMERAGQIDMEAKKREQYMMNNVQMIQNNQMTKGFKAMKSPMKQYL